jgi:hypothetical protein
MHFNLPYIEAEPDITSLLSNDKWNYHYRENTCGSDKNYSISHLLTLEVKTKGENERDLVTRQTNGSCPLHSAVQGYQEREVSHVNETSAVTCWLVTVL